MEATATNAGNRRRLPHERGRVGRRQDMRLTPVDDAEADGLLALVAHPHCQVGAEARRGRRRLQRAHFLQMLLHRIFKI